MTRNTPHYLESELMEWLGRSDTFELLDTMILDGLWLWDLEHPENEYMSPTFWRTLGFDPSEKEHLAKEWLDLIFPEDGELAQARAQQHLANPEYPFDQIVRYKSKSGETVTIRCRGKALLKDGKPYRLFGAHTVVADQKRSAIQQRVDELMRLSNDPIISWTESGGIETWNAGAQTVYRVKEADALGKPSPFELSGAVLPEPWNKIKAHLDTGNDWVGEIVHQFSEYDDLITASRITAFDLDDGRRLFLKISRDETQRIKAQKQNLLLLQELRHRVRNLFAVVQSITRLSARSAKSVNGFMETLQGRISALSAAHTADMSDEDVGPAPIHKILVNVLEPYMSEAVTLDGPDKPIILQEDALTPFSLLIHELTTNAAKYGGWSHEDGSVHIKWREHISEDGKPFVKLEWTETGGKIGKAGEQNTPSDHKGFGTLLIENSAKQLRGTFDRTQKGDMLCITLTFPL